MYVFCRNISWIWDIRYVGKGYLSTWRRDRYFRMYSGRVWESIEPYWGCSDCTGQVYGNRDMGKYPDMQRRKAGK
jgi:hypothetical protein